MKKTIKVLAGNPGVGKTQQFIESIDADKRYVYVAPTRVLAQEVMKRLEDVNKPYQAIFTGLNNQVRQVIHEANVALGAKETPILIITHKCLASVKPELLKGWELVVDEAPKVEQIDNIMMLASEWERIIAPFVGDVDHTGHLIIESAMLKEAIEIHAQGIEDARNRRSRNTTLLMVLDAMLTPTKNVTATSGTDKKGRNVIRVSIEGFVDFTQSFDHANSVTLMGAHIEKSLLVLHARKKNFGIDIEKAQKHKEGLPYIYPLVRDNEGAFITKTKLLTMPDGSVAKEWNPDCFGQQVLNNALRFIGDQPAIFASHSWCTPELPKNVEQIPFDSRGLNQWKDKTVSIHMIHGNPSPDELRPIKNILGDMGIPLDEGRAAMRWAREEDLIMQHAYRTALRDEEHVGDTIHIVTSYTQAIRLRNALGGARIVSYELMVDPPEGKPTEGQSKRAVEREELATQARVLREQGMGQLQIAHRMGISQPKVSRLLKGI
jgi:hypothetical protein